MLHPAELPAASSLHADDGFHIVIAEPFGDHRLWFPQGMERIRIAILVPLDGNLALRLQALQRFHRLLNGRPSGPMPRWQELSAFERHRAVLMLRAWDGIDSGATRREVAGVLFRKDFRDLTAIEWKTTSERRQFARVLGEARAMIAGGYLRLLRADGHRRR